MFIVVGGFVLLAVTALALRVEDQAAHTYRTGITLAILTGLVLLTIGTWTTLSDTSNITHWVLKILVTVIAVSIGVAAAAMRSTRRRDNPSRHRN
jgi:cytochrome bd-type quinol oxidase subunit 2